MKRIGMAAIVWLALVLTLAACGGEKYEPQPINEAIDVCVICKMAIKDDQFATQIITKDGQSLKFDDIGCLNEWKVKNGTDTIGAAFVRDYDSKQWIRYEKAYYVYDASYQTPMAYGIVSFEKEQSAKAFMAEQGTGTLMSSDELANHSWEANHQMMNMDGHGEGDAAGHGHETEHGEEMQHEEEMNHSGETNHDEEGGHGESGESGGRS